MTDHERGSTELPDILKYPVVLPALLERLNAQDSAFVYQLINSNLSISPTQVLDRVDLLVAPKRPTYDLRKLQKLLDGLIEGLDGYRPQAERAKLEKKDSKQYAEPTVGWTDLGLRYGKVHFQEYRFKLGEETRRFVAGTNQKEIELGKTQGVWFLGKPETEKVNTVFMRHTYISMLPRPEFVEIVAESLKISSRGGRIKNLEIARLYSHLAKGFIDLVEQGRAAQLLNRVRRG